WPAPSARTSTSTRTAPSARRAAAARDTAPRSISSGLPAKKRWLASVFGSRSMPPWAGAMLVMRPVGAMWHVWHCFPSRRAGVAGGAGGDALPPRIGRVDRHAEHGPFVARGAVAAVAVQGREGVVAAVHVVERAEE